MIELIHPIRHQVNNKLHFEVNSQLKHPGQVFEIYGQVDHQVWHTGNLVLFHVWDQIERKIKNG